MITLVALYVPGDRPDRFAKAGASGADVVVVDLEDAVPVSAKAAARRHAADWLAADPGVRVEVRVNAVGTPWHDDDLSALASAAVVRLPKVTDRSMLDGVVGRLTATATLACLLEDAAGVLAAPAIAAHPRVSAVALGEADLSGALGVATDEGLAFARGMVVAASRAAGLGAPMASIWPHVGDLDGLAASTRRLAGLGFVGRMAIHPAQVPVIRAAFRPDPARVDAAHALLAAVRAAGIADGGVIALPDGRMVDPAMITAAEDTLTLAHSSEP